MAKKPTYEELEQWVKSKSLLGASRWMSVSDHNYKKTLNTYDRLYILYEGRVVEEGGSEKTYRSKKARKAYLGYNSLTSIEGITAHLNNLMKEL